MMLVQHILATAQQRLAVLSRNASVCEAAKMLLTLLVVVCDDQGLAVGVVSRTDVIKAFSSGNDEAFNTNAGEIMSTPVYSCHIDQTLQSLWRSMGARGLRSAPVLDALARPLGVVYVRDVALALLEEVENEEGLLRDYIMGIGYY
jgi:CBS domain-containing protein